MKGDVEFESWGYYYFGELVVFDDVDDWRYFYSLVSLGIVVVDG